MLKKKNMKRILLTLIAIIVIISIINPQSKINIKDLIMIDGKMIDPNTDELYSGRVFDFYENKVNKKLGGFYRSGLKNSKWIWWNTNGRIDSTGSYRRGYMYGQWKWYYNNGQLFSKGYYRNGNGSDRKIEGVPRHGRYGKWIFWNKNGFIKSIQNWKNGKQNGIFITWHDNGLRESEITFKAGKKEDFEAYWDNKGIKINLDLENANLENDKIKADDELEEIDVAVEEDLSNEASVNEEEAAHADVDEPDIEIITEYYSNDNLRLKGYKEDGEYWGVFTEWYENGSIKSEKTYVGGTLSGPYKIWYENGELKEKWNFENNKKIGPYYKWYNNGIRENKGYYKKGLKNGLWYYWNENEEKIKVVPYKNDRINGEYIKYLKGGAIALYRQYANGVPSGKWGISDKLNSGQMETILEYTQELIENDELKTAMQLLNSMLEKYNYNDNTIIPKAHLKLADIYNKRINDYDRAIIEYTKIIESYENTKEQPLALYNIIRIYKCKLKSGQMESIKQKEFLDMFPGHELAGKFNNDCKKD